MCCFWEYDNRNLSLALKAALQAGRIDPENALAWGILAEVYLAKSNLKEALPAVDKACRLTKSKRDLDKYEALRKKINAELEKIDK
jgi:cytochrome c-type biogenesis protein CcmH/NrfG